jgi:hypothetical protein
MRIAAASLIGLVVCSLAADVAASRSASSPLGLPLRLIGGEADPKPPPAETAKVAGKVVDRGDGTPVVHAQVSFDGPKRGTTWTDDDGAFEFEGPTGDYKVTVKVGGKSRTFPARITKSGLEPSQFEVDK